MAPRLGLTFTAHDEATYGDLKMTLKNPVLTINMIVCNEEKHMEKAVQSLLGQTYAGFTLLIVDNGSTDTTGAIADSFAARDPRVKVLHVERNDPLISFKLMDDITSKYYMFAAGHDFYAPQFIERCIGALDADPEVVLAYPRSCWFKGETVLDEIPGAIDTRGMGVFSRAMVISYGLVEAYQFYGIYRLEAFKKINRHKVIGADHLLLTELAIHGYFALVNERLFFLRKADDWGDTEVYRKKHVPDETDGVEVFLKMARAYMSLAESRDDSADQTLFKMAFFTMSLLRYRGIMEMFGTSMEAFFARQQAQELLAGMKEMVSLIEQDLHGECSPKGADNVRLPEKKKVRIAGEGVLGQDLTQIQESSEFEEQLKELVTRVRPASIIETGTYLGTGTTRIIASALRKAGLFETKFYTIECNPKHYQQAVGNLAKSGLAPFVTTLLGLSVPRALLPDMARIEEETVKNVEGDGIFVDHQEENRAAFYYGETNFSEVSDDLLGQCLERLDYTPSIVLLDSGGHLGNVEFNYVVGKLKGECYVVLDDVYHVKHHKSFQQIKEDPRFTVITSSQEKFGFCMAHFDPKKGAAPAPEPRNILFVRSDSIGDSILAMTTLKPIKERFPQARLTVLCQKHVAPLYQSCPYCDDVVTVDTARALEDEAYREELRTKLHGAGFDLCLNGTYSRNILSDFLCFASGAPATVALESDLSNMSQEDRNSGNNVYSTLVPSPGRHKPELERHRDLLKGIGIDAAEPLTPKLWLSPEDFQAGDRLLKEAGFAPEKTVVLFAGAQYPIRNYRRFGEAIREVCRAQGLSVLALGVESDRDMNRVNLDALSAAGVPTLDLSGSLKLRESAALISRCRIAIGTETGLAHIACAVGTTNVILLGGGHFGRFMPYSGLTSIACLPLECYDCNWQCPYQTPHCITDIDLRVLQEAFVASLREGSDKPRMFVEGHALYRSSEGMPHWGLFNHLVPYQHVDIIPVSE